MGFNGRWHRGELKQVSPTRIESQARGSVIGFAALFMLIGIVAGTILIASGGLVAGPIFGGLFFFVGVVFLVFSMQPRVFDRESGLYPRGLKPSEMSQPDNWKSCALDSICALPL